MNNDSRPAIQSEAEPERKSSGFTRFLNFVKRNPTLSTLLIAVIIILGIWGFMSIKSNRTVRKYESTITEQRDSLNSYHLKNNVRIFTWAVRSELTRGNMEQVEQFFVNYLQTGRVVRVMLIDPNDGTVIISTNKKDIETKVTDSAILTATSIVQVDMGTNYKFANPVMGLDKKLGIVVVEIEK